MKSYVKIHVFCLALLLSLLCSCGAPTPYTHSYGEWTVVTEPTCTQEGKRERSCTCGEVQYDTLAVTEHSYVGGACSVCGVKDPSNVVKPDYGTSAPNTVGNELSYSRYASQAGWIYFSPTAKTIAKIRSDGTQQTTVYQVPSGYVMNVQVVGDWIYFYCEGSSEAKSYIAKVRTDGEGFEKIVNSVYVWDMLVVKETVLFTVACFEYNDFAKDCMPLYSISVNGGPMKMIYDGFVSNITADETYVYFLHTGEDGVTSIHRMKHDTTKETVLRQNVDANRFFLKNGRLYFLLLDPYGEGGTLASITTNGGGYTEYATVAVCLDYLYVIGTKLYYYGAACSAEEFSEEIGLVEYDTVTKTYRAVKEEYENMDFLYTNGCVFQEIYANEVLTALWMYDGTVTRQISLK